MRGGAVTRFGFLKLSKDNGAGCVAGEWGSASSKLTCLTLQFGCRPKRCQWQEALDLRMYQLLGTTLACLIQSGESCFLTFVLSKISTVDVVSLDESNTIKVLSSDRNFL